MNDWTPLLRNFDSYLSQAIPAEPASLYDVARAAITNGGKRIRPMLTGICAHSNAESLWFPAAAAVELLHTFTLVHDDIMDNAATRRGKPAIYIAFGMSEAILAGDAIVALATKALSDSPRSVEQLAAFSGGFQAVCEGQALDKEFEGRDNLAMEEYLRMIELKTARIFELAAVLGAVVAGGSNKEACGKFARKIGIAFQIQDDVLDLTGGESFGKTIGGDILEGKRTILFVLAMNHKAAIPKAHRALFDRLRARTTTESDIPLARSAFEQMGILSEAAQMAERYSKSADEQLRDIPEEMLRENLRDFSRRLLGRTV